MGNNRKPNLKAFLADNLRGPMSFQKKLFLFLRNNAQKIVTVVAISASRDVDRVKNLLPVGEREVLIHLFTGSSGKVSSRPA